MFRRGWSRIGPVRRRPAIMERQDHAERGDAGGWKLAGRVRSPRIRPPDKKITESACVPKSSIYNQLDL